MDNFEAVGMALAKCPACNNRTLKSEAGCHECMNPECGYGVCS